MFARHNKSIAVFVITWTLAICTAVEAYDAWPSDFEWISPQTLVPASELTFTWRFHLSPSYYRNCHYDVSLYLSADRTFSSDDYLFYDSDTDVPAGANGFTETTTFTPGPSVLPSLPKAGTYYVFLKLSPGSNAPADTNISNNTIMASSPVQIDRILTVAVVIMAPHSGQSMVVVGYDDGTLEFRDWQGNILATRDDLEEVTALETGIVGSPPLPRLLVASTDSSGALRVVDPSDIKKDIASRFDLGSIIAIDVCNGDTDTIYIGTSDTGGTLHKLNALTLADDNMRTGIGNISEIIQLSCAWGDLLAVGCDKSDGSVHFLDKNTLDDVVTPRQGLGTIYELSSADMDLNGEVELIIASESNGGSIRLTEGPNFASDMAIRNNLGHVWALDYGRLEPEQFIGPTSSAWILVASESNGGSLRVLQVGIDTSIVTLEDWATLNYVGIIPYAKLQDFYMVGIPLIGAVLVDSAGPRLHVLDESLIEQGTRDVPSKENFDTGDFSKFPWKHFGDATWNITSNQARSGTYSAQSGQIDNGQSSTLQITLDCIEGDVTFYRKVSCMPYFDFMQFWINGVEKGKWSGEKDWAEVSFPVTAGTRTFKWSYSRDTFGPPWFDDAAWIDDIVFPIEPDTE